MPKTLEEPGGCRLVTCVGGLGPYVVGSGHPVLWTFLIGQLWG